MDENGYIGRLLELLKLDEIENYVGEQFSGNLSFRELVIQMTQKGEGSWNLKTVMEHIFSLVFSELTDGRTLLIQMLLLVCLFAVFQRFLVQGEPFVSEMSFFLVYGGMMLLMMQSFLLVSDVTQDGISSVIEFVQVLVPAYATTLMLSGNAASAGIFYEMMFGIIYVLEWALKVFVIPAIHIYVLLMLMDHFFLQHKFSKFGELIASAIHLFRKVAIGGVLSLSAVQSLLAPARDRISQSAVLKSLSILPGVGNGVHLAEEVLLSCGMLVKNSVGVAGLVILLLICLTPVIKVLCFCFLYKFTAAVLQPVSDARILGAVSGVAKGCTMYFEVMVDAMLLFLIAISMITASTSFVY